MWILANHRKPAKSIDLEINFVEIWSISKLIRNFPSFMYDFYINVSEPSYLPYFYLL